MQPKSEQITTKIHLQWDRLSAWIPIMIQRSHYGRQSNVLWFFSWMLLMTISHSWAFDSSHSLWDKTLKKHVEGGLVDYQKLKQNRVDLEAYLRSISNSTRSEFEQWDNNTQLAFLINLYNAATIQLILDEYPIESIKDIGFLPHAAWRKKFVQLWGTKISLNHLEHEIILPRAKHLPSVHFALVCAAKGCPPLRSESYTGTSLNGQLKDQGQTFLSNTDKNRISIANKTLHLSPIFDWYAQHFKLSEGSVKDYLSKQFPGIFQTNLDDYKIRYTHYDWSLNEPEP
jgi:hypothetical protein